jgi:16S rRNA (cytidine1402-2'-O)-methyltransferase
MTETLTPALYVVATPLGNLEDITLRALRVLKEVSVIACEDTRQTQKLLNKFGIETKLISYHDHNEQTRSAELIVKLEGGESVALVSDAGTPGISDPGYRLITLAIRHRINVVPIPGPAAFVAALTASGLPTDAVSFSGFLSAKRGERRDQLSAIKDSQATQIFYEAPHRLLETLEDVVEVLGDERKVVVAREVTKIYEEFIRGIAQDVFERLRHQEVRGEITLLIGKADASPKHSKPVADIGARLAAIMTTEKLDEKAALKILAKETGLGKSELYRRLQRQKGH